MKADRGTAVVTGARRITRPSHVNIDTLIVLPRDQAGPGRVHQHD